MITINREDFSDFVKSMRMSAGLDQKLLASRLNIKTSEIKRYEEGRGLPDDLYAFEYDLRAVVKQVIESKKLEQTRAVCS